tara:strand:+ start:162 stop:320 length:159 start_codon:yes stop_codon:yes gene_type:complete
MGWIKDRLSERTTLDGVALIVICGSVLVLGGLVEMAAWAGLAYGIFTAVRGE